MKKKYKIIITILILLIIILSTLLSLKKNKNYVNSVESFSKKYLISYENGYTTTEVCHRYYDGVGTKIYSMNDVDEGYPMYILNNCAVSLSSFLNNVSDSSKKNEACNVQKEYTQKNIASYTIVDNYNSTCKDITGELETNYSGITCSEAKSLIESQYIDYLGLYKYWFKDNCLSLSINVDKNKTYYSNSSCESLKFNNEFTGILKYTDSRNTCGYDLLYINGATVSLDYYINNGGNKNEYCSYMKGRLQSNYISTMWYAAEYNKYCSPQTESNEFKSGVIKVTESGTCANYVNIYNGKLAPTMVLKKDEYSAGNSCNWNVYYYKGQPYSFVDIFDKEDVTTDEKIQLCNARFDEINGTPNKDNYDVFNTYCSSIIGKSLTYDETIDVVFQASNAYGLECRNISNENFTSITTGNNECTYRFKKSLAGTTITLSYSELPKTSALKQLTTGANFSGWKREDSTTCSSSTGGLSILIPSDGAIATYSACFELADKKSLGYTLYQNCDGDYVGDVSSGTTDVKNTPLLYSNVTATKYIATTSNISETVDKFKINNFCTISCTESVNYNYPTIFETVKSGTYFELLSYPEVKSYLTCQENFSYDNWRNAYENQIKEEKKAYVKSKNSTNINNLSFSNTGSVCSSECNSCLSGCCGYTYWYTHSATTTIYSYDDSTGNISSQSVTFSYCPRWSTAESTKASAKFTYKVDSGSPENYSGLYNTAKSKRITLETANTDCSKALKKSSVSTDNYYKTKPNLYFYYESIVDANNSAKLNGDSVKYTKDTLKPTSSYMNDTDVHDWGKDTFYTESIPISFAYDGNNFTFNSTKTNTSFLRTVTRNYVYNKSDSHPKYYAKNQTGDITTSASDSIELGYVYPVPLTISGTRKVYFALDFNTNLTYGAKTILSAEGTSINDKNIYQCYYDITNDVIIEDNETFIADDFKKNFYIRSISIQDVDPNDRFNKGLLGANWSTTKGQTLIAEIEKKAETKDTYNSDNLEYSFTLNATTIEAIKSYNLTNKYDDFKMDCNNLGGECKSKFLKALNDSKLDGKILTNVNPYMKRLTDPTWKYYIGDKWYLLKTITDYKNFSSDCNSFIDNGKKAYYECLYKNVNEGVLP